MNKRYLATLAAVAVLILTVGVLIRPSDRVDPEQIVGATPLDEISREGAARDLAVYFAEQAVTVGERVVYLAEHGTSGFRWQNDDMVVTTLDDSPVAIVAAPVTDGSSRRPEPSAPGRTHPATTAQAHGWALVVGRRPDNSLIWSAGLWGGTTTIECGGSRIPALVASIPLNDEFAGAAVFDLDGRALAVVARCGERMAAIPLEAVADVIAASQTPEGRLLSRAGVRVAPLDARTRLYFESDTGLLVVETRSDLGLSQLLLRPGDLILSVDRRAVKEAADLHPLIDPADTVSAHAIQVRRNGRVVTVIVRAAVSGIASPSFEIHGSSGEVAVVQVGPGSGWKAAGLRSGDVLLRVGRVERPDAQTARRIFSRAGTSPIFVVYQRGRTVRGVLLP
ncbi:MAG: hypothetical protein ABI647_23855 [Gemmatimonadota bacterium]